MRVLGPPRFLLQPVAVVATFLSWPPQPSIAMLRDVLHPTFSARLPLPYLTHGRSQLAFISSAHSSVAAAAVVSSSNSKGVYHQQTPKKARESASGVVSSTSKRGSAISKICPGCGVTMQDKNPSAAGFYVTPRRLLKEEEDNDDGAGMLDKDLALEEDDSEEGEDEDKVEEEPAASSESKGGWTWVKIDRNDKTLADLDAPLGDLDEGSIEEEFAQDEERLKNLDGFSPAGPGFGKVAEDGWNQVGRYTLKFGKMKKDKNKEKAKEQAASLVVCARCHELRHYGKVKDPSKESLLPDFDFDRTVGARLARTHATRTVVVMVVDSSDFDGSFPRRVAALLAELEEKEGESWKDSKSGNVPRLVLVANKIDLLPKQISPVRLDAWIRRRAKEGGASKLSGLFLVSCLKNWGVKAVLESIKHLAGPRGEVWVVGAQNAGKSSLINALAKVEAGAPLTQLTEAPLPGTTLGLVRLGGILPAKAKLFDTPGLLHPHQITVRLDREEQKLVQVRKELTPRTYRVMGGDTIHVGGLVRLDVKNISASSMYITVWGSVFLTCHFAKTRNAEETFQKHVGVKLQPPATKGRLEELGPWVPTPVTVTGDTWEKSSIDIAVAGMGWFGLGIKGTADLTVWTFEGVGITTRTALIPDRAHFFEKAGFTVVKGGGPKSKSNAKETPQI